MISEKDEAPASASTPWTTPSLLSFAIQKVFGVRILEDISALSCGACSSWCGRCRRGRKNRLAMDPSCEEFEARIGGGATTFEGCAGGF
jgi:hypothetical protein